jgi:hypothetical protein
MRVRELLKHLNGAGLTISDWDEMEPALAEVGLTLETSLNEAQWTAVETVKERAIHILTDAGLDVRVHDTAPGLWVAEVCSKMCPGRKIWVTDSEGDEVDPFLVGVYPASDEGGWFEATVGACTEDELVFKLNRALEADEG